MSTRRLPRELGCRRIFRKAQSVAKCSQLPRNARLGANPRTSQEGPFGEVIRATGPAAALNPLQFSTKYLDAETGLLLYGMRLLNVSTGRWLNRDPLGERGGNNLYFFVRNFSVSLVDSKGGKWWWPWGDDDEKIKQAGLILEATEPATDEMIEVVVKNSQQAADVYNKGRACVAKSLELARTVVKIKQETIGEGPQYDDEFFKSIGAVLEEGKKYKVSKAAFLKAGGEAGLAIFSLYQWGKKGGEEEKLFLELRDALVAFKSSGENDPYNHCLSVCFAAQAYVSAIPDATGYGKVVEAVINLRCFRDCCKY